MELKIIAKIYTPMKEKFGLPRQSGLAAGLKGRIVFEKEYSCKEALEGLEEFEYLWVLWGFDEVIERGENSFRPQVRPPRLGGNEYRGVFATRSPYRPNPIGLSCVKLEGIEMTQDGPVIIVSGVDMRDGTPVYDIKPYLPYAEAHPGARGGFTDSTNGRKLEVVWGAGKDVVRKSDEDLSGSEDAGSDATETGPGIPERFTDEDMRTVTEILSQDPRPAYHDDPERVYGMSYKDYNVRFKVSGDTACVTVIDLC